MRILVLDTKNRVVENISRYQGTVNSPVLRADEVYWPAVIRNCPAIIICHNHPSGDPTPSPEDRPQVTRYFIGISPEQGFFYQSHVTGRPRARYGGLAEKKGKCNAPPFLGP
jgi:DNA repair protein RadC